MLSVAFAAYDISSVELVMNRLDGKSLTDLPHLRGKHCRCWKKRGYL